MKLSFPHPLIILLIFVILSGISTYLIPAGEFERRIDEATGREVVIGGTYQEVESQPISLGQLALAIPEGLIFGADLVVLIIIIGGAFYVVEKTGALQVGIEALIYRFRGNSIFLLVCLSIAFSIAGGTIGMQEEIIAMAPILVMLANKLNYDKISIIGLSLGSALLGAGLSPINPFNGLLAQNIAELNVQEGIVFRLMVFVIGIGLWTFLMIRKGKSKEEQTEPLEFMSVKITWNNALILILATGGVVVSGWGITQKDWGFNEMSALFFAIGIVCGLLGKMGLNGTARAYTAGFSEMIFAGVIVGLARSVYIVLEKGMVIDTMIQGLFSPLESLPDTMALSGLYLTQLLIHIPVPSTSGHAVLTIPLATPLMDLLGISRQLAVFTYQYPASMMDMLTPTNGGMMAVIAAAGINYKDWIKYILKSWILLSILCLISVFIALIWFG
ncbi:YfcC family protein [Algoriphagus sp. PAP.12]|uniref:YfcC family protein n=1 Tax=Algoriphagus sp. PAP.12 TaxID=2996678 RepID=UPI00227D2ABF|nr:YfcC family protein [Algoriphagus sp. PAP.12]